MNACSASTLRIWSKSIPGAELTILVGVRHIAPLPRPKHVAVDVLAVLGNDLSQGDVHKLRGG